MFEICITNKNGIDLVDSRLLHKKLEVASYHRDWIRRRVDGYGFEEGQDYYISQRSKMSGGIKTGGSKIKDYLLTLDMAKELCMLENNAIGQKVRRYFIQTEKEFRETESIRLAGKRIRRTLTDSVTESGENERMHGHGFSTYTLMIYEIVGIKPKYKEFKAGLKRDTDYLPRVAFRDTLTPDELNRVEAAEALVKPLLDLEKKYPEIKETLKPLFETKKLEEVK